MRERFLNRKSLLNRLTKLKTCQNFEKESKKESTHSETGTVKEELKTLRSKTFTASETKKP